MKAAADSNVVPINGDHRHDHDDQILGVDLRGSVTETHLDLDDNTTFDEWSEVGRKLQSAHRSLMWWIGDWLNFGESKYGEKYTQALETTTYSRQTLKDAAWVAGKIETSRRRDVLTWSHHKEVTALTIEEQEEVLGDAAHYKHTRSEIREQVRKIKSRPEPAKPVISDATVTLTKQQRIERIRELSAQSRDSYQIAQEIGVTPKHTRKLARDNGIKVFVGTKIDDVRVVDETVRELKAFLDTADLSEDSIDQLDASQIDDAWIPSLEESSKALRRLIQKLKIKSRSV